jgi:hypothetical protein
MIEAHFVEVKGIVMQISQKRKNDQQDNLLEELLREKAAVLSRAGMAVDEAIQELIRVDNEIEIKKSHLNSLDCNDNASDLLQKKLLIREEINISIDKFNTIHEKAQTQYYYLIVTREALGLRRHEMIKKIYRIPDKKEKYRPING